MALIIPKHYTPKLLPETTEQAIKGLKESFQRALAKNLNLRSRYSPVGSSSPVQVSTTTSTEQNAQ